MTSRRRTSPTTRLEGPGRPARAWPGRRRRGLPAAQMERLQQRTATPVADAGVRPRRQGPLPREAAAVLRLHLRPRSSARPWSPCGGIITDGEQNAARRQLRAHPRPLRFRQRLRPPLRLPSTSRPSPACSIAFAMVLGRECGKSVADVPGVGSAASTSGPAAPRPMPPASDKAPLSSCRRRRGSGGGGPRRPGVAGCPPAWRGGRSGGGRGRSASDGTGCRGRARRARRRPRRWLVLVVVQAGDDERRHLQVAGGSARPACAMVRFTASKSPPTRS